MENTKPHASQIRYGSGDNRVDKTLKRSVLSFSDYAAASAAAATLPTGQVVDDMGNQDRYIVENGILVFSEKLKTLRCVDDFKLPEETDYTAAIHRAIESGVSFEFVSGKTYPCPGVRFTNPDYSKTRVIRGNGAVLTGDIAFITDLRCTHLSDLYINHSQVDIEGVRYCEWNSVEFSGLVRIGRLDTLSVPSWSMYWNDFTQVRYKGGVNFHWSGEAYVNSNTWNVCEFRPGAQDSLMKFTKSGTGVISVGGNSFIGCDLSYAPVFDISEQFGAFGVDIIGGYIDSGTKLYKPGSIRSSDVRVNGIRNPSGYMLDQNPVPFSAQSSASSGGLRKRAFTASAALNLFKTPPKNIVGGSVLTVDSEPVPMDGDYTVSLALAKNGGAAMDAIAYRYIREGVLSEQVYELSEYYDGGYVSYTFSGLKRGDVVRLILDGGVTSNFDVVECACTPGAGVYGAIPYRAIYPEDKTTVTCNNGVAATLFSFSLTGYELAFYRATIYTKNPTTGGGGEKIVVDVSASAGSSTSIASVTVVSRASQNGTGGTANASGTLTVSATTSGRDVSVTGLLSGSPASVVCDVRVLTKNE